LLAGPFQVLEGFYEVSPDPSLLQAEEPLLSQPFLIGVVFHPADHFSGPPLDLFQQVHFFLVLGTTDWLQNEHPQVLLDRVALNPFSTEPVFVLGIALTHLQDLALGLVELHEVRTGPPFKSVEVPLDGIPSLSLSTAPHSSVSSTNLRKVHSVPLSMSLTKMLSSMGLSTDP